MSRSARYDVCVVGGGPAGSAAAVLLARAGASVLLAEAGAYEDERPGEHLAPDVAPALALLGAGAEAVESPGTVALWEEDEPAVTSAVASPFGGARTVRRGGFDRSLAEAARAAGAVVELRHRLGGVERGAQGWRLTFLREGAPRAVAADFVVDATGRRAAFARHCGARIHRTDSLVALVGWTAPAPGAARALRMLHVEAVEGGWWYAVALPDDTVSTAFFTPLALLRRRRMRAEEAWADAFARSRLVAPLLPGGAATRPSRRIYPAAPALTAPVCGPGWLAVGDAAVQFDPLEGRGVRRALELAFRGAEAALLPPSERDAVLPHYAAAVGALHREHCRGRAEVYARAAGRLGSAFLSELGAAPPAQEAGSSR